MKVRIVVDFDRSLPAYDARLRNSTVRLYHLLLALEGWELPNAWETLSEMAEMSNHTFVKAWRQLKDYNYIRIYVAKDNKTKTKWLAVKKSGSLLADTVVATATTAKKD